MADRIIIRTTLADLPKIRDRYPFLYLEHGRVEVDDSSIKWISAEGEVFRLPAAVLSTLLLGPGTSVTHEAVKVLASLNTTVCWVGEDSLLFYAVGQNPTADSYNLKKQIELSGDPKKSLAVARKMFLARFPEEDISNKTLRELMTLEGNRVRFLYEKLAEKYLIVWKGRSYTPGNMKLSDMTNQIITSANAALYALVSSVIHSLGLSPRIGFVHSGSPLPFVYDIADLYKEELVFDMAFSLTPKMAGIYNRHLVLEEFRNRVVASDLLVRCPADIISLLELKK
ncbi:MAG: CRISPR-associated endonuclease Cas1 [Lentisphaerae bacterium ADurb.Bin242]|nr:MAG: CRISPR-associated endonuclease Cas1 [Lentisphaerae bacterium ADurb.Bin242]